jgi:hypothetical protein
VPTNVDSVARRQTGTVATVEDEDDEEEEEEGEDSNEPEEDEDVDVEGDDDEEKADATRMVEDVPTTGMSVWVIGARMEIALVASASAFDVAAQDMNGRAENVSHENSSTADTADRESAAAGNTIGLRYTGVIFFRFDLSFFFSPLFLVLRFSPFSLLLSSSSSSFSPSTTRTCGAPSVSSELFDLERDRFDERFFLLSLLSFFHPDLSATRFTDTTSSLGRSTVDVCDRMSASDLIDLLSTAVSPVDAIAVVVTVVNDDDDDDGGFDLSDRCNSRIRPFFFFFFSKFCATRESFLLRATFIERNICRSAMNRSHRRDG